VTVRERTGHLPSYAVAKKMKSLTLYKAALKELLFFFFHSKIIIIVAKFYHYLKVTHMIYLKI